MEFLREYPILWLPCVCASLLDYFLNWLQKVIKREAIVALTTSHSVLGGNTSDSDYTYAWHRALAITAPISLGFLFAIVVAYVAGFVVTACLVREGIGGKRPDLAGAFRSLRTRIGKVLIFSVKLILLFIVLICIVAAVFVAILYALPGHGASHSFFGVRGAISVFMLLMSLLVIVVAWFMVSESIQLIGDLPAEPVPAWIKTSGWHVAILAAVAGLAINLLTFPAISALLKALRPDQGLCDFFIRSAGAIAGGLPLAFLWIALALLAYEAQIPEIPCPS